MKESLRLAGRQLRSLARYLRPHFLRARALPIRRDPPIDPPTAEWFRSRIRSSRAYLEYGSGVSTLLAADAGVPSVSIESDRAFAQAIRQALPAGARSLVVDVSIGLTEDWGYPVWIFATRRNLRRWRNYPLAGIARLGDLPAFPDLVLVDGRFRRACVLAVTRAAVERGIGTEILVDDYAGRPQYHEVERLLGRPEPIGRAALFRIGPATARIEDLNAAFELALRDFS